MNIIYIKKRSTQLGFTLYFVLIIMLVIAFLVVAAMQSTSMNLRTTANDSDYQIALQNAESGLKAAQDYIRTWPLLDRAKGEKLTFNCKCDKGLCAAKNVETHVNYNETTLISIENCGSDRNADLKNVWERDEIFSDSDNDPSINSTNSNIKYRYVIEYLGLNYRSNGTSGGSGDTASGTGDEIDPTTIALGQTATYIFRVTAKGWGHNERTTALIEETLQVNAFL